MVDTFEIKKLLRKYKVSQVAIAREGQVSESVVSRVISGNIKSERIATIVAARCRRKSRPQSLFGYLR